MIYQVGIKSLPQEWLWCETWCDNDSKKNAKTIDLVCEIIWKKIYTYYFYFSPILIHVLYFITFSVTILKQKNQNWKQPRESYQSGKITTESFVNLSLKFNQNHPVILLSLASKIRHTNILNCDKV